jgi:hypothetical protein
LFVMSCIWGLVYFIGSETIGDANVNRDSFTIPTIN